MPVLRMLPTAVLLLGLLSPLAAAAQSPDDRTSSTPVAPAVAFEGELFILVDGPVDLTPTPEELAAASLVEVTPTATASATAPSALTAYPNPAVDRAAVRFTLEAPAPVRLAVYDLLGREIAVLVEGPVEAGTHEAVFDGSRLSSGLYLVRLDAGGAVHTQRLTLAR